RLQSQFKFLWHLALGQRPRQLDRGVVGFQINVTGQAAAEVSAELGLAGWLQRAIDEVEQQLHHGLALRIHCGGPSSKCRARRSRSISRARCSRLFTAGTLSFNTSATSAFGKPSTSASTKT